MSNLPNYNYMDLVDQQPIFGVDNTPNPFFYDFIATHGNNEIYLNSFMLKIRQIFDYMPKDLSDLSEDTVIFLIRWLYGDDLNKTYGVRGYYYELIKLINFFSEADEILCYFAIMLYNQLLPLPSTTLKELYNKYEHMAEPVEFVFKVLIAHKEDKKNKRSERYFRRYLECASIFFKVNMAINTEIKKFSKGELYNDVTLCIRVDSNECIRSNSTLLYVRFPVLSNILEKTLYDGESTINLDKLNLNLTQLRILMNYYHTKYFDATIEDMDSIVDLLEKISIMDSVDKGIYGNITPLIYALEKKTEGLYDSKTTKSHSHRGFIRSMNTERKRRTHS